MEPFRHGRVRPAIYLPDVDCTSVARVERGLRWFVAEDADPVSIDLDLLYDRMTEQCWAEEELRIMVLIRLSHGLWSMCPGERGFVRAA